MEGPSGTEGVVYSLYIQVHFAYSDSEINDNSFTSVMLIKRHTGSIINKMLLDFEREGVSVLLLYRIWANPSFYLFFQLIHEKGLKFGNHRPDRTWP